MRETEEKCHICGSTVHQTGPNVGQCTNENCGAEHTTRSICVPNSDLSANEYKDFYG